MSEGPFDEWAAQFTEHAEAAAEVCRLAHAAVDSPDKELLVELAAKARTLLISANDIAIEVLTLAEFLDPLTDKETTCPQ